MRLSSEKGATAADEDGVTVALKIKSLLPCVRRLSQYQSISADSLATDDQSRRGSAQILDERWRAGLVHYGRLFTPERRDGSRSVLSCAFASVTLEIFADFRHADGDHWEAIARAVTNPLLPNHLPILPSTLLRTKSGSRSPFHSSFQQSAFRHLRA